MHQRKMWFHQLLNAERVFLTGPNYLKRIRLFLTLFAVVTLFAVAGCYLLLGMSSLFLTISAAMIISLSFITTYCYKHLYASSVKGGTFILSDLKQRSHITSLRSLSKVRSSRIGGLQMTTFQFKLDGVVRKGMIINTDHYIPFNTDRFLKKATELYKKQKANL